MRESQRSLVMSVQTFRLLSSRRRETRKYGLHDMSIEYDIKNIEVCILFTIQLMMANLSFELFV